MNKCFQNILYFDRLNSSSDYIIDLYKKHNFLDVLTVYVDEQVKGRGRIGKLWFSNKQSLSFSFSIALHNKQKVFDLTMLVSFALCDFLRTQNIPALVKYPNDIIVNNKKIAGVLTEIISIKKRRYAILGVGFNLNNNLFPDSIPDAVSLYALTQKKFSKKEFFHSFIVKLDSLILKLSKQKIYVKEHYISFLLGWRHFVPCLYKKRRVYLQILNLTSEGFLSVSVKSKSHVTTVN